MIRERNGIHIEDEEKVILDGSPSTEKTFVSHAHFDHFGKQKQQEVICSNETAKLIRKRSNTEVSRKQHKDFELIDSGHVLGSKSLKFSSKKYGDVLYTGDVSTRDRAFLEGFNPVDAETLILETTYGISNYVFPSQEEFIREFRQWIEINQDKDLFMFGYSLGKAQKILYYVQKFTDKRIYVYHTINDLLDIYEEALDLSFDVEEFELSEVAEHEGENIYIIPSTLSDSEKVEKAVNEVDGLKAGFSGWAVSDSFKYRGGYDETFVLSDHCDFRELTEMVEKVGPERVYTFHGFDEAFAKYLRKEGLNARALRKNQSSLSDF